MCALPVAGNRRTCGACERKPRWFDSAFAAYLYGYPLDRLIQRFKYGGELDVGRVLAELGSRALEASAIPRPQALVPVPLARAKLRERGFNQALELAKPIARALSVPIRLDLCARVRAT